MKLVKSIVKLIGLLLIGLIIAAVVIPIVFKDDIVAGVKDAINDNIQNATVDFSDVDISLFNSFPNAGIIINDAHIAGLAHFEGTDLLKASRLTLDVSLPSLFDKNKPLEVRKVIIDNARLNIKIDNQGRANYDIVKPVEVEETEGNFVMKLSKYDILNTNISYRDVATNLSFIVNGIDHTGSGKFFNEQFDLDTKSTAKEVSFSSGGVSYLNKGKVKADAIIEVDLASSTYTLRDNDITINALDVLLEGFMQVREKDMKMDFAFSSPNETAKGLMSIIPGVYSKQFANVNASGGASFQGMVKGVYNEDRNILPAISVDAYIKNGALDYPSLPKSISNINSDISIKAGQGDYSDLVVNVPAFDLQLGEDKISGRLVTSNLSTDPTIEGALKGKIILDDWNAALPSENIEQLSGIINSDVTFAGKQSSIAAENYNDLSLEGTFQGENIIIKNTDQPTINVRSFDSSISPESVRLSTTDAKAGKSDFNGSLVIDNPLAYFVNEGNTNTKLISKSTLIDANEWMTSTATGSETKQLHIPAVIANVDLDMAADQFVYQEYDINAISLKASQEDGQLNVSKLAGTIGKSDFDINGILDNSLAYFNDGEVLKGSLNLLSTNLLMEDFMQEGTAESEHTDNIVYVPEDMDIAINVTAKNAVYDKVSLKGIKGKVQVNDSEITIENGIAETLGGKLKFSGLYGTPKGEQPDFAFKYDISKMNFGQAASSVDMAQSLMPIINYIGGTFNSTLVMEGKLGDNMFPDLNTLNASGFLETLSAQLQDLGIADRLADKLGIEELRKLNLNHTKNWFEVIDGRVEIKPFEKTIAGIDMAFSGSHGLGKSMNYHIIADIPRDMLKGNIVTGTAEAGLSLLESQASKIGLNIDQGDFIKVKVDLTGSISSPDIKITPLGSGGTATVKDIVKEELEDLKETVKDSINTVIEETKETVRDTVTKVVDQVKDSVNTVVDETVEEVKDSVKTVITDVVEEQIDKVIKDTIASEVKEEIKEILNETTGGTVDDIKDKLDDWNPFKKKKKKKD